MAGISMLKDRQFSYILHRISEVTKEIIQTPVYYTSGYFFFFLKAIPVTHESSWARVQIGAKASTNATAAAKM